MATLYFRVEKKKAGLRIISSACNFLSASVVKIMIVYMHREKTRMMHVTGLTLVGRIPGGLHL